MDDFLFHISKEVYRISLINDLSNVITVFFHKKKLIITSTNIEITKWQKIIILYTSNSEYFLIRKDDQIPFTEHCKNIDDLLIDLFENIIQ